MSIIVMRGTRWLQDVLPGVEPPPGMTEKQCQLCREVLPVGSFGVNRSRRDGLQDRCRPCRKSWHRRVREIHDSGEYARMLERQGGGCALCKRTDVRMSIDHDYATDKIRGLLCTRCNHAIEAFTEAGANAAARYLQHQQRERLVLLALDYCKRRIA